MENLQVEELKIVISDLTAKMEMFEIIERDLETAKKLLKDADKPVLMQVQADEIAIEVDKAVQRIDFSDENNYDIELSIDYNNTIIIDSIEMTAIDDITESICDYVLNYFRITE